MKSPFEIIVDSTLGSIVSSSKTRSLLFQFSSSITTTKSIAAVLLGVIHNSTGQISYRLVLINFDSTSKNHSLSDELRLWMPFTVSTQRPRKFSNSLLEEEKNSDQTILIIFIIILSLVCLILILIIIFLCYRRKGKTITPTISTNNIKRPSSSLSMIEKFQAPDLTTKVTLLTHFRLTESDFGTDV
jgi:hypothetical protein